jgi:S-adenosylmethionine hydrolase
MAIVTLITDWGNSDYYPGAMKGIMLSQNPDLNVVDISHEINLFDHGHGMWVLGNCWNHFPEGTVHVIGFQGQVSSEKKNSDNRYVIAAKFMNHYFIACNDGFLNLLFGKKPEEMVYVLSADQSRVRPDFEVLASAASFLSNGGQIKDMGKPVENFELLNIIKPVVDDNMLSGYVIFIDRFGNAIVNITKELLDDVAKGRSFEIRLRHREYRISKISEGYESVDYPDIVAFFNTAGYLEIALRQANASELLGLNYNDIIRIEFV